MQVVQVTICGETDSLLLRCDGSMKIGNVALTFKQTWEEYYKVIEEAGLVGAVIWTLE